MFGSEESCKPVRPNSRRRVLKPPGGGSSDIFGAAAEPVEPQRKVKTHLTSSIFAEESAAPSKNKADSTPSPTEAAPVMNGNTSSTTSAVSSAAPTPTNTAPAAGRQRIPPGGFSSGLW